MASQEAGEAMSQKINGNGANRGMRMHGGPTGFGVARTHPLGRVVDTLNRTIPHEMAHKEHYDQRRLVCVKCSNAPRMASALLDTEEGYVCKAVGACVKRQSDE